MPETPKMLKAANLRGVASLTTDGHLDKQKAVTIIVGYIKQGRVKASLESIQELKQWFTDPAQYGQIERAFREQNKLPRFDFDPKTAEASIESQVLNANFRAIPAVGHEPMPVVEMMKEHKVRLSIRLMKQRAPRKPKAPQKEEP